MNLKVSKLLYKIKSSPRFESLYRLENDFLDVGLSIRRTSNDNMVLCKIEDGHPKIDDIIEDYVFAGSIDERKNEVSDKMMDSIIDFVQNTACEADELPESRQLANDQFRRWQKGVFTYGSIMVVNEDVNKISSSIVD